MAGSHRADPPAHAIVLSVDEKRSVIETARRRAIGVLDAIRATLNGSPLPNGQRPAPGCPQLGG